MVIPAAADKDSMEVNFGSGLVYLQDLYVFAVATCSKSSLLAICHREAFIELLSHGSSTNCHERVQIDFPNFPFSQLNFAGQPNREKDKNPK